MAAKRKSRRRNIWPFGPGQLLGSREYHYHVRSGVRSKSSARHKGYMIYNRGDGFAVPQLDRESVFDTKRDAKRFIDDTVKGQRKNPGSILDLLYLAQATGGLKFGSGKKKNPAGWIKAKALRIRRARGQVLVDVLR